MASHHHHHHHQSYPPTTCCGGGGGSLGNTCNCNCNQTHHCFPQSPVISPTDPLIEAVASQILQSSSSNPYTRYPKSYTQKVHRQQQFQTLNRRLHKREPTAPEEEHTHSTISSLLCRIEALEASLHRFSLNRSHCSDSYSLRDLAARIIQTHYRAFLVRRSRTLRQLKDLALVKSSFNSLKSSLPSETHIDFNAVSRKAMDLLLKLDSIQGGDPMIRDGKKSISRDLVRFLDCIDGIAVKRQGLSFKAMKNARLGQNVNNSRVILGRNYGDLGGNQREMIGKLRERVEKIRGFSRLSENDEEDVELEGFEHVSDDDNEVETPRVVINGKNSRIRNGILVNRSGVQPKVKKSVSFAENGNVFKIISNSNESISFEDGSCLDDSISSDDRDADTEEFRVLSQGTLDDYEEANTVNGDFSQASDRENNLRARITPRREVNYEIIGHFEDHNGDFLFSAPLPVKMEDKADLRKS
ncbi:hypothetical protein UlMin_014645 [Ulmus minor]